MPEHLGLELIYVIVNDGLGSGVLHIAKQHGISGGTIFLGQGTVRNAILEMLAMSDIRKEIVLMAATKETSQKVLEKLSHELKLHKPNHGIAFSIPVAGVCGSRGCHDLKPNGFEGTESTVYQSIMIIVDKGKGEEVVEAAAKAGSKGATIINARGSGIHETSRLFAMDIEPEKEIVLIVSDSDSTNHIVASIRENFQIEKPGNGIVFVQNVTQAFGLFDN